MSRAQHLAGQAAARRSNWIGAPVVILTATVGTSIFATIESRPAIGWVVVAGLISLTAAVLSALQTFFNFASQSEKHRAAGAHYAALHREYELMLLRAGNSVDSADLLAEFATIVQRHKQIDQESLGVPDRFYDQARREEAADDEGI
jgi:hypothetical protein